MNGRSVLGIQTHLRGRYKTSVGLARNTHLHLSRRTQPEVELTRTQIVAECLLPPLLLRLSKPMASSYFTAKRARPPLQFSCSCTVSQAHRSNTATSSPSSQSNTVLLYVTQPTPHLLYLGADYLWSRPQISPASGSQSSQTLATTNIHSRI